MKYVKILAGAFCIFLFADGIYRYANRIYFEVMHVCQAEKTECECVARSLNKKLTYSQWEDLKGIFQSGNYSYLVVGAFNGDPISRAVMETTAICAK